MNEKEKQERHELIRDLNLEHMKNNELRAKIRQHERTIQQLRATLAELGVDTVTEKEIEGYTRPQRGRPQRIDIDTRQRIKKLKEGGLTVRDIAKKEGVSIGTVSAVINERQ